MDENQIRAKMKAADRIPSPSPELVERMALRAACIENGRLAEKRLEELAHQTSPPDPDNTIELAAKAALGRIAMVLSFPAGASADMLTSQLMNSEKFRTMADKPVDKLLSDVRSGRLLKALTKADFQYSAKTEHAPEAQTEKGGLVSS